MRLMLPMLRADFQLVETYKYSNELLLQCPITAIGGHDDAESLQGRLAAWREQTRNKFSLHFLSGDHFFIHARTKSSSNLAFTIERITGSTR